MYKIGLLVLLIVINSSKIIAQQITPKIAFLEKWENSKSYLIAIAEKMPEENYDFKPTERQMSFKEQLIHINENMEWLSITYFTNIEYKKEKKELSKTKKETILALENTFDVVLEIITNTPEEELNEPVDFFAGT
ncbi:MAG: DinB family protein [Flavobacteriaceae bacterium]|nr:DinB family protein [Flavobacteriaceae bacterium]|tara:strand:- start:1417 stop:1821 length:405 start_codon:yes stop_codon:yes gene_type:complete